MPTTTRGRSRFRPALDIESLEVRSLLSAIAAIDWKMAPQVAPDPARGNQPDLPNTSAYVNPKSGYGLTLDASGSTGVASGSKFAWTVSGPGVKAIHLKGEQPSLALPQGNYKVTLQATGLAGSKGSVRATTTVQVKDVLIVSIGDSFASGEGNPVVPGLYFLKSPQWGYSPDPAMNRENALAHRSTISGPGQFALQLQQANPHEAVTFVSVASSGATVAKGLLGPMTSVGDSSVQLPAQLDEVRKIIGSRHIDALTVSIGGNDLGFTSTLTHLIEHTASGYPSLATTRASLASGLKALPATYAALGSAIQGLAPSQVLITEYPDISRDQTGAVATILGPLDATLISKSDAQFASAEVIAPLDAAVAAAARANHWTYVTNISADFATHGYPSTDSWVRTFGQSLRTEESRDGTFHPNLAGNQDIGRHILANYLGDGGH